MSKSRFLYSAILYLLFPVILLRLFLKSRNNKQYRLRLKERLGWITTSSTPKNVIWLHVVSVGETIAAKPLIKRLLQDYPQHSLLITSTTPTGSATVKKLFAKRVLHSYFPYDLPHLIRRFIKQVKPQLVIIIETEIWPNLYAHCAQQHIPLLLVNARLSKKSTTQYLRFKTLISETLSYVEFIAVRSEEDKAHFLSLGASQEQIELMGNIKFDIAINHKLSIDAAKLKRQWGIQRPVWVAASTHAGEDVLLLTIFRQLKQHFPSLLLIIVPRHPERFVEVEQLLTTSNYQLQKRTDQLGFHKDTDIILGDSMGEMLLWYAAADVAFIGGSLVQTGGHNPLEATALGIPVISGPHTFNFNDIYPPLCEAKIAWVEQSTNAIQTRIKKCLINKNNHNKQPLAQPDSFKLRCDNFMQLHQGVVSKLLKKIKKYL